MRLPLPSLFLAALTLVAMASSARAATILHLTASAAVKVTPDELEAELAASATGRTPAVAQSTVNAMVERALALARQASAVAVSTAGYSVWQTGEPDPQWRASETILLSAKDSPALLTLVGALQAQDLAVSQLSWRLAASTAVRAEEKADAEAIAALRARATATAKLLGLGFHGFREVWLDLPPRSPVRPMALAATRASPPPQALPGPVEVRATVTADAELSTLPGH